jgi:transposase
VEHFAAIDVSLELSSVCVVDGAGKIVSEAKVASEPEALVRFFRESAWPTRGSGWRPGQCRSGCTPA